MGKKDAQRDEHWAQAKKLCRLNARQIEMAKRLGMSPKSLPGLIPAKSQRWKLPVGRFIEESYEKRFGQDELVVEGIERDLRRLERDEATWNDEEWEIREVGTKPEKPPAAQRRGNAAEENAFEQAMHLSCYLSNLAIDLDRELAAGRVAPETIAHMARDLGRCGELLLRGDSPPQVPYIDAEGVEEEPGSIPF